MVSFPTYIRQGQLAFCVSKGLQLLATLAGGVGTAFGAVATHFKTRDHDVKTAVALNLSFEPVEKITLKFHDLAAAQACHMNMIPLGTPFVIVLLALHVHQVKFVYQAMPLQQIERSIDGDPVNAWVEFACMTKDLRRVEMLFRVFNHLENRPPLMRHAQPARGECSLQAARYFCLGEWHCFRISPLDETELQ